MKKFIILASVIALCAGIFWFINLFSAVSSDATLKTFTIERQATDETLVIRDLEKAELIKSSWALNFILSIRNLHNKTKAGGYYLSKNMNIWQIASKVTGEPDLKWITFAEGLRKEQIGEMLKALLNWNDKQLSDWNNLYKDSNSEYFEGVYFPDTYLIPVKESPEEVATRMISHFSDKTKSQMEDFAKQDILWTTGLKIASIIQREAGGMGDMPIISAVIWNRLNKGMALEMDATIQYAKGKVGDKWWSIVTGSDIKNVDSVYNTYEYKGLPPHPISSPGLFAIDAVLNPANTDCLFYLHDHSKTIHCATTYQEHLENIKKYLN